MAEIKGIDVSRWNGNIDWKTVASYGMGFAILRITEKGNIVDSTFEPNYKGCIENKIPVGVYKYSYATTIAQIKNEANVVIKTLNKRKLDYPVFLDIEDKCQENLSDSLMMKMIEAFKLDINLVFIAAILGIRTSYQKVLKSMIVGLLDILIMIPVNYRKD